MANSSRWRWLLYAVLILVALPILVFTVWAWASLKFSYSSGQRSGYIQKISQRGWVCKTWEGELVMVTMPGVPPQVFPFSVRDTNVAHKMETSIGQRVAMSYDQHRYVPTNCFGETEYFATSVQTVGQ